MADQSPAQSPRFIRLPDVIALTGLSKSLLYVEIEAGRFPRKVKLTERAVGWVAGDVAAWVQARIEGREWRA